MKVRKFFNDIHLWGGLISGIVVFIVCITGTIYTYNTELRALAMPEFNKVKVEGEKKNADQLLTAVKPEGNGKVVGVKVPYADNSPTFFMYNKKEKEEEGNERKPETAKAQESQKPESTKELKEEKTSE